MFFFSPKNELETRRFSAQGLSCYCINLHFASFVSRLLGILAMSQCPSALLAFLLGCSPGTTPPSRALSEHQSTLINRIITNPREWFSSGFTLISDKLDEKEVTGLTVIEKSRN